MEKGGTVVIRYIYDHLPGFVKKPLAHVFYYSIPFPYNRGICYANIYRELLRTQWLDEQSLLSLQFERLRRLLLHAYENVPYYKKLSSKSIRNGGSLFQKLQILIKIVDSYKDCNTV